MREPHALHPKRVGRRANSGPNLRVASALLKEVFRKYVDTLGWFIRVPEP